MLTAVNKYLNLKKAACAHSVCSEKKKARRLSYFPALRGNNAVNLTKSEVLPDVTQTADVSAAPASAGDGH